MINNVSNHEADANPRGTSNSFSDKNRLITRVLEVATPQIPPSNSLTTSEYQALRLWVEKEVLAQMDLFKTENQPLSYFKLDRGPISKISKTELFENMFQENPHKRDTAKRLISSFAQGFEFLVQRGDLLKLCMESLNEFKETMKL